MSVDIKYTVERARNLSRELKAQDAPGLLSIGDSELCGDALTGFAGAIREEMAFTDLGSMPRAILAIYADEMADDIRSLRIQGVGPTDGEFLARALEWHANDLDEPPAPALAA